MTAAGVERAWAEEAYANVDELLSGRLGPPP